MMNSVQYSLSFANYHRDYISLNQNLFIYLFSISLGLRAQFLVRETPTELDTSKMTYIHI